MKLSPETIQLVIDDMYENLSVKRSCEKHGIELKYFHETLNECPLLYQAYECAQQAKAENFADEVIEIADEDENPMRAKNRIDTRRWYAAVMKPKKFGERIDLNLTQTVDIRGALEEARQRALLPVRFLNNSRETKVLEIRATKSNYESDRKSDGQPETKAEDEKTLEDLLK